jgi:Antitoxin-like ribbon-helix-helix
MPKRTKLTDTPIGRRAAGKGAPAKTEPSAVPQRARQRPPGAKGVVIEMNNDGWRAVRMLAFELETSMQKLGIEAFNDLLRKHGRSPVIVNPYGLRSDAEG